MPSDNNLSENSKNSLESDGDVCRDFLRNTCKRGKMCKFKHPVITQGSDLIREPIYCHDYQNGTCRRSVCKFLHYSKQEEALFRIHGVTPAYQTNTNNENEGTSGESTIPICKDFLNHNCRRGSACKFRHSKPSATSSVKKNVIYQSVDNFQAHNNSQHQQHCTGYLLPNLPAPPPSRTSEPATTVTTPAETATAMVAAAAAAGYLALQQKQQNEHHQQQHQFGNCLHHQQCGPPGVVQGSPATVAVPSASAAAVAAAAAATAIATQQHAPLGHRFSDSALTSPTSIPVMQSILGAGSNSSNPQHPHYITGAQSYTPPTSLASCHYDHRLNSRYCINQQDDQASDFANYPGDHIAANGKSVSSPHSAAAAFSQQQHSQQQQHQNQHQQQQQQEANTAAALAAAACFGAMISQPVAAAAAASHAAASVSKSNADLSATIPQFTGSTITPSGAATCVSNHAATSGSNNIIPNAILPTPLSLVGVVAPPPPPQQSSNLIGHPPPSQSPPLPPPGGPPGPPPQPAPPPPPASAAVAAAAAAAVAAAVVSSAGPSAAVAAMSAAHLASSSFSLAHSGPHVSYTPTIPALCASTSRYLASMNPPNHHQGGQIFTSNDSSLGGAMTPSSSNPTSSSQHQQQQRQHQQQICSVSSALSSSAANAAYTATMSTAVAAAAMAAAAAVEEHNQKKNAAAAAMAVFNESAALAHEVQSLSRMNELTSHPGDALSSANHNSTPQPPNGHSEIPSGQYNHQHHRRRMPSKMLSRRQKQIKQQLQPPPQTVRFTSHFELDDVDEEECFGEDEFNYDEEEEVIEAARQAVPAPRISRSCTPDRNFGRNPLLISSHLLKRSHSFPRMKSQEESKIRPASPRSLTNNQYSSRSHLHENAPPCKRQKVEPVERVVTSPRHRLYRQLPGRLEAEEEESEMDEEEFCYTTDGGDFYGPTSVVPASSFHERFCDLEQENAQLRARLKRISCQNKFLQDENRSLTEQIRRLRKYAPMLVVGGRSSKYPSPQMSSRQRVIQSLKSSASQSSSNPIPTPPNRRKTVNRNSFGSMQ